MGGGGGRPFWIGEEGEILVRNRLDFGPVMVENDHQCWKERGRTH